MEKQAVSGKEQAVLAVDIGGTFTDVALEQGGRRTTVKVLTNLAAPELGVLEGLRRVLVQAGIAAGDISLIVHGTTLATNAIIERKGARTALITTEGFRDSIEIGYENRFDQYDILIEKPKPLVPRPLRFGVPERLDARGEVRLPLDIGALEALAGELKSLEVESIAVGFLHSYVNPMHERAAGEILSRLLPDIPVTLSSEICPEAREYDRFTTATANAYVQPLMARYLGHLRQLLVESGFDCPVLLMTSGGGLTTLDMAAKFPIRLVESGPAGGAILASQIARDMGLDSILSFDMGGTTAKICLIDDGHPLSARSFEVDRQYHYMKGSGLPLRIPVIEMVEIGAGGGSIAGVDAMKRIAVGPESAGSSPGPACYARGGKQPTVTDANLILGKLDPAKFAGGSMKLDREGAIEAVRRALGEPLDIDAEIACHGINEMVEEHMANAARVHAVERGKDLEARSLIAFGGSAPLHAARLAEKLGIRRVIIPRSAGVGSAVGFLRAPIAFEVVRSRRMKLSAFDPAQLNAIFAEMQREAHGIVQMAAPQGAIAERRVADMRYAGQGHDIEVPLPPRSYGDADAEEFRALFEAKYRELFGRTIPNQDIELIGFSLQAMAERAGGQQPIVSINGKKPGGKAKAESASRLLFDPKRVAYAEVPVFWREDIAAGTSILGPAIIAEDETTTVVTSSFVASIDPSGAILLSAVEA